MVFQGFRHAPSKNSSIPSLFKPKFLFSGAYSTRYGTSMNFILISVIISLLASLIGGKKVCNVMVLHVL